MAAAYPLTALRSRVSDVEEETVTTQVRGVVSRGKAAKLLSGDFEVQASITDVLYNSRLVTDEARRSGVTSPLLDVCLILFGEAEALGLGTAEMVAVVQAIAARTEALNQ